MKKYYTHIKEWFASLVRRDGSFDPERDWKIIFITSVLFFVLSAIFNGYIFWSVKEGKIFTGTEEVTTQRDLVNEKSLDRTLQYFEGRGARLDNIRSDGLNIVDPSL